jgi:hypothetical protein
MLIFLVVIIVGCGAFLATWDVPAPIAQVVKVLPDDRFPR